MRTVIQSLSSGKTSVIDSPLPVVLDKGVLSHATRSLISIGTEKSLVKFGQGNLAQKARQQPDKVKAVVDKVATDGAIATLDSVRSKLNQPIQMGYCSVGNVVDSNCEEFSVGDRIVCNGPHAEVVSVSRNLAAKIPSNVSDDEATFVPVAAIGLQGIRLINPSLGETVVVMGLGLIGLLTVQLLVAQGCNVIGTDYDESKVKLAEGYGASGVVLTSDTDVVQAVKSHTSLDGVDAVIITASTNSSDPITHAAQCCRKRGRIVLVGVTGLQLNRADFYEKELTFQVSCSYGAGRYDPFHEEEGNDYPIGYVRWTEKRNFEAVLQLMQQGRLSVKELITSRYSVEDAGDAYSEVTSNKNAMGILLEYPDRGAETVLAKTVNLNQSLSSTVKSTIDKLAVSFIGSGNYASRILMPAFQSTDVTLDTVVNRGGVGGSHHGAEKGFKAVSTDADAVLKSETTDVIVVATRHDTHAKFVCDALHQGKHVFVEKPLGLTHAELDAVQAAVMSDAAAGKSLMIGFNRRFAPLVENMKTLLDAKPQPKCFNFTMNAGAIPGDSWVQSIEQGGGRIIGEACHLIDLMRFLAGSPIKSISAMAMGENTFDEVTEDKAVISLQFEDGSIGSIQYFANGGKVFPKERLEVFVGDAVLQLDNYRSLRGFGWQGFKYKRSLRQNKGQTICVQRYVDTLKSGKQALIPLSEILEVSRAAVTAAEQIRSS